MPAYERPDRPDHVPPWLTVRLLLWRARPLVRLGVATLVLLAVVRSAAPPAPSTVAVVVAARTLAAGQALGAADLRTVRLPTASAPHGAVPAVEALVGATPVVAVPEGLPVVEQLLGGDRFDVPLPAGWVVVPLRLADPAVVDLLRPGDRIDVVAASTTGTATAPSPDVLARAALVLGTAEPTSGGGGLLGGSDAGPAVLLVGVDGADGARLAAGATYTELGAVLLGPGAAPGPGGPAGGSVG